MNPRFRVIRTLGSGGEGHVFAVTDAARGGSTLALKETTATEADSLRREFTLLARLNHPHLVQVFDFFASSPLAHDEGLSGPAAYTQEWVDGPTIFEILRDASEPVRRELFIQVMRALSYLHALNVIHCDLKPENVLVETKGGLRARLLDFGIAVSEHGSPDGVKGSRSYVSPERLAGKAPGPETDLYALGVMMAEVWLGHPPSPAALSDTLRTPKKREAFFRDQGVPETWLDVVTRLTSQAPQERPQSVWEASQLWGKRLGVHIDLHTPGSVAAIVRGGPLVGRDALMDELAERLARGSFEILHGNAGTGKTALGRTLARRLQVGGYPVEFWPETQRVRSVDSLVACMERLLGLDEGQLTPASGSFLPPGGGPIGSDAAGRYDAWCRQLCAEIIDHLKSVDFAGTLRSTLIIDDLHLTSHAVQTLVSTLIEDAAFKDIPLSLLALTAESSAKSSSPLEPLDRTSIETMTVNRLGTEAVRGNIGATLAAACGGHPAHLESLLALLVARGDLVYEKGQWSFKASTAQSDLPSDIKASIAQRIALLSDPNRVVLSAVGWLRFPADIEQVIALLDNRTDVAASLLELEAAGLVRRDSTGAYRLGHNDLRELLSTWKPSGSSQAAHQRVLDNSQPTGLALAWHTGSEQGTQMALEWAQQAIVQGDLEEAVMGTELALECTPNDSDSLHLRAHLANLLGPRELQISCLETLLSQTAEDAAHRLEYELELFWALTRVGDADRAITWGRRVVSRAASAAKSQIHAEALIHLANMVIQKGAYDEGENLLLQAQGQADSQSLHARIENNLGNIAYYRDQYEAAYRHYEAAHRLKVEEGDRVGQRIALGNMGMMSMKLHRPAEAMTHLAASRLAAIDTGHRRGEAWTLLALAQLGLEGGALAYAERRSESSLRLADTLGDRAIAWDAQQTLAEIALARGDAEKALELIGESLKEDDVLENPFNAAGAQLIEGFARVEAQPQKAIAESKAILEDPNLENESITRRAIRLLGEGAHWAGDIDAAMAAALAAQRYGYDRLAPDDLLACERALGLWGESTEHQKLLGSLAPRLETWAARWPEEPFDDGVGDGGELDGPSKITFENQPVVITLKRLTQDARGRCRVTQEAVTEKELRWTEQLVHATGSEIERLLGEALGSLVALCGAERAFVTDATCEVLVSRDADGDAVKDATSKLPRAAAEAVLSTQQAWHAIGEQAKGSLAAFPLKTGETLAGVVVLQNRFSAGAFEALKETQPELSPLALCLRLQQLENRLQTSQQQLQETQQRVRQEQTRNTEELLKLRKELESTRDLVGPEHKYPEIIFQSRAIRKMLKRVDRIVETDLAVYIRGESGTGKELVARAVHNHGSRADGPFIAQNCSAIPKTLFESEFFGHEKGAFTGADRKNEGLFTRASGGTLFLDEIGDLSLDVQAKLLRVLETSEVRPVGSRKAHKVDVRIVCATHRDLLDLVDKKQFREDLYYRLNVVRVDVPPLRERAEDVPVLVDHFLALRFGDKKPPELDKGVMKRLVAFDWPGNVRQLENEITRASLLCDGTITPQDLSPEIRTEQRRSGIKPRQGEQNFGLGTGTLKARVDRLESEVIQSELERYQGNKSRVARSLGLSRAGLNMKLKRLDIWNEE